MLEYRQLCCSRPWRRLNIGATLDVARVVQSSISATKIALTIAGQADHYEPGLSHVLGFARESRQDEGSRKKSRRGLSLDELGAMIEGAPISVTARQSALVILQTLAAAEAKVHNADLARIRFHEIGIGDALLYIVCAAVGTQTLGVDRWICSPLNLGGGNVVCAQGCFPVPQL